MKLYPEDINWIGSSATEQDGFLMILTDGPNVERILLREILSLTGHRITDTGDWSWEGFIYLQTDLPWDEYRQRSQAFSEGEPA